MRKPMTDEHKRALKEGRQRHAEAGGAKQKVPRQKRAKPERGRFTCDDTGTVTIFEPDLVHGVNLDCASAMKLCHFLQRSLPWPLRAGEVECGPIDGLTPPHG